jgi:DNA topoisomerase-1
LPGSELFQYLDPDGNRHTIDSADVNAFLREISGRDVTAKDFRTWAATSIALLELSTLDERPTTKGTFAVVKTVATRLRNTPAICRKCYIHPAAFEAYLAGSLKVTVTIEDLDEFPTGMWKLERELLRFLKRLAQTTS